MSVEENMRVESERGIEKGMKQGTRVHASDNPRSHKVARLLNGTVVG